MTRRIVLCLGPHRSGTSVVTAGLQALGADLRLGALYINDENEKGFFEHPDLVAFDEKVLTRLGTSWDDPACDGAALLAAAGLDTGGLDDLVAEGADLIRTTFADAPLAAIKDPRLCLLMPLWHLILARAGYAPTDILQVHVLRDPFETARSQMLRQAATPYYYEIGRNMAEGAALWLSYGGQALEGLREGPALMVRHADTLVRPAETLDRIATAFGITPDPGACARFAADFVDTRLYRSKVTQADRDTVAAALPDLIPFAAALDACAAADDLTPATTAAALALFRAPATQARLGQVAQGITGRLSHLWRETALHNKLLREQATNADRQIAEYAAELTKSQTEYAAELTKVETSYTAELTKAEAAVQDLSGQLASLSAESNRQITALSAETTRLTGLIQLAEMRDRTQTAALAAHEARIAELLNSRSWRLTAPVRALGLGARRVKAIASDGWLGLNRRARGRYRQTMATNPALATRLRSLLWPVLRLGNRHLLGKDYIPLTGPTHAPDGTPLRLLDYQRPQPDTDFAPHVTVIVPNYNHAPYLRQRLDTIYAQTYAHFDVILMDDCSSDDSRAILQDYAARYPDQTRLILNDTNSGGVFYQWEKGLAAARGDLVWIAESDDWCSPNFLETLVPFFRNEAVQLAYARTEFMDGTGQNQIWSMDNYLADLGAERWHRAWVEPAPRIVAEAFGLRNIIPNVSSALFRRMDRLDVLGNATWRTMRTCGDWVFYLNVIRGGCLAYSPAATNYYRLHQKNTSVGSYSQDSYYREHETVAIQTAHLYRVDPVIFDRQEANMVLHWRQNRPDFDRAAFEACYSLDRIRAAMDGRKPAVLMVGYAFCAGGGETFAVQLANQMKVAGFTVTYLDCAQEPREDGIRRMLAADIPVVSNFEDLARIVSDFDISIVHSHHAWVDNSILDILPEGAVQTIVTTHGMYETIQPRDLDRIVPRMLRRTARFVHIADKNTAPFTSRGADHDRSFVRIDNALEPLRPAPLRRADIGLPDAAFVLTLVSRAIPPKGWDEAIAATARARAMSGRDIRLVLVGAGPVHDRMAADPALPDFVTLAGFQSNTRGYFALADMGFLPSRFEGESFPLVLIECLQAGRPMLASAIGEIPRMLSAPEGGFAGDVIPLDNWTVPIEDLASRIAAFATDPAALAAAQARVGPVAAKFDPALMRQAYARVYLEAVGQGPNDRPE